MFRVSTKESGGITYPKFVLNEFRKGHFGWREQLKDSKAGMYTMCLRRSGDTSLGETKRGYSHSAHLSKCFRRPDSYISTLSWSRLLEEMKTKRFIWYNDKVASGAYWILS